MPTPNLLGLIDKDETKHPMISGTAAFLSYSGSRNMNRLCKREQCLLHQWAGSFVCRWQHRCTQELYIV